MAPFDSHSFLAGWLLAAALVDVEWRDSLPSPAASDISKRQRHRLLVWAGAVLTANSVLTANAVLAAAAICFSGHLFSACPRQWRIVPAEGKSELCQCQFGKQNTTMTAGEGSGNAKKQRRLAKA
jgi:hypothetical protein